MTPTNDLSDSYRAEMQRFLPRNFVVSVIEGAVFAAGTAFIEPTVVLPRIIETLHGPTWLIAMLPLLQFAGVVIPQPFVAHHIEKLHKMKPYVVLFGGLQRFSYLLGGLVLLFAAASIPPLALAAVVLTPVLSGLFGGLHVTAWQELVAKTIPPARMPSLWAARFIVSAVLGMIAGKLVSVVLSVVPGTQGYGSLYCCTFTCTITSLFILAQTRETKLPPKRTDSEYGATDFVKLMLPTIRADRRLRCFILVRVFSTGIFVISPFLGIHALRTLGLPDSALGAFVTAQMVGSLGGYLLGGFIGHRFGAKPALVLYHGIAVAVCFWAVGAHTHSEFLALFFLLGTGMALNASAMTPLGYQICPTGQRIVYFTIMSLATMPGFLLAWALSTFGRSLNPSIIYLALPAVAMLVTSLVFVMLIRQPRTVEGAAEAQAAV